jgi:hypothetical protein
MKFFFLLLISILLIFTGFTISSYRQEYHLSRGEELVNIILARTAKIIKCKYDLQPCGEGASMPGGPIQELALGFDTKQPYTKEELRELLVKTSQELLTQINENTEMQEFLKERPFTIKNVQIIIDPNISVADISQGILK